MDRYDFPYRPDMKPGMLKAGREAESTSYSRAIPCDAKFALALFIIAVFTSFGVGAKIGAIAQDSQSAVACQPR